MAGGSLKEEFFRPVILQVQILARLNIDIDRIGKRDLLLKSIFLYRVTTIFRQDNLVRFVLIYFQKLFNVVLLTNKIA